MSTFYAVAPKAGGVGKTSSGAEPICFFYDLTGARLTIFDADEGVGGLTRRRAGRPVHQLLWSAPCDPLPAMMASLRDCTNPMPSTT